MENNENDTIECLANFGKIASKVFDFSDYDGMNERINKELGL